MARRRQVSVRNDKGEVSFFAKGKGIAVPKRKPELCFSDDKAQFPRTQGQKDWILHVKKERAKLKREIVKEVEKLINKKIDGGKLDLFEFEGETNKIIRTTARLAIEMWEKRK